MCTTAKLSSAACWAVMEHTLFGGVFADQSALQAAAAGGGFTEQRFAAGETIATGTQRQIGLLITGEARVYSTDCCRQVLLRPLAAGDILGIAQLFAPAAEPLSRITAHSKVCLLWLDEPAVRRLLDTSPRFRDNCLAYLAGRVAFLNRKIACFTAGSAERRLALYLCAMAGEADSFICSISRAAIADSLDISRASLYRAMDTLEADGFLLRTGKQFTLCNRADMLTRYQA